VRPPRVLHTTTFRLAAVYVAAFAISVATLGVVIYVLTTDALERRLDVRIENDMRALRADYRASGVSGLVAAVSAHELAHPNGAQEYAVLAQGARVAGHISHWPKSLGWSTLPYPESDGDIGRRRFLVVDLDKDTTLVVAADPEQIDQVKQAVFDGFLSAFGAVLILGILGGIGLSLALIRRVEAIRRTAEAIIAGDLSRRVPVHGSGDDFDRLAQTLNHMLDRIGELMESLRQVSANIAHDLKTPLARLRQRLETALTQPDETRKAAMASAIAQVDEILATFAALLRIAQIESGSRRAVFSSVNLSDVFVVVAEAFAPAAEDAGQTLRANIAPNLTVVGDRELLTQMLANVIDNAIRHTNPGTTIVVDLHRDKDGVTGFVSDNGRGVPAVERQRIFQRFHRLPESQSVSGSGLGLSLVKAVANIHEIVLAAQDAAPGLRIEMCFPPIGNSRPAAGAADITTSNGKQRNASENCTAHIEQSPRGDACLLDHQDRRDDAG
jgi:signal transduction histidine kinase